MTDAARSGPRPTLVCSGCRRVLNAAGAKPGRRGRCPSCGAIFQVPEAISTSNSTSIQTPQPPTHPTLAASRPEPSAVEVDASILPDRAPPSMHSTSFVAARTEVTARPIGRGGFLPPPDRVESTLFGSLVYPFWDLAGLAWMVALGAGLAVTGLVVFGMIPAVLAGGNIAIMGPFAFGMLIPFGLLVGYTTQILADVLISGAGGEVVHPRWPDIDLFAILGSLFGWLLALSPGLAIGIGPLLREWSRWGDLGPTQHLFLAAWLGLGLSFSWMGLASMLLHNDFRALNPLRVIREIGRVGVSYLGPCLLTIAASVATTMALEALYGIPNFFLMLLAAWVFSGFFLYESLVVFRTLGLCCHRNAKRLGWFSVRDRWGVRG